jgi:hypothetical protein
LLNNISAGSYHKTNTINHLIVQSNPDRQEAGSKSFLFGAQVYLQALEPALAAGFLVRYGSSVHRQIIKLTDCQNLIGSILVLLNAVFSCHFKYANRKILMASISSSAQTSQCVPLPSMGPSYCHEKALLYFSDESTTFKERPDGIT